MSEDTVFGHAMNARIMVLALAANKKKKGRKKGGKYADVLPNLPTFQPGKNDGDPTYQEKVILEKEIFLDGVETLPASTLARAYVGARSAVEDLKTELSLAQLRLTAVSQLLTSQYDEEDVTSIKITGATVRVQVEPYATVKDRDAFRKWCIDNDLAESLMLPWPTTNSITKERLLAGESEPTGVEAFQKNKIVLTRDK